jgi:hypothetical protein
VSVVSGERKKYIARETKPRFDYRILHREDIKQQNKCVCVSVAYIKKILTIDTLGRATELADSICIEKKRILR